MLSSSVVQMGVAQRSLGRSVRDGARLHFTFRTHWVKKPSETSFVRTLTGERRRLEMILVLVFVGIHLQSQPSRPHSGPRPARCLQPPSVQPNDKNIVALSAEKVHVFLTISFTKFIFTVQRHRGQERASVAPWWRNASPLHDFYDQTFFQVNFFLCLMMMR